MCQVYYYCEGDGRLSISGGTCGVCTSGYPRKSLAVWSHATNKWAASGRSLFERRVFSRNNVSTNGSGLRITIHVLEVQTTKTMPLTQAHPFMESGPEAQRTQQRNETPTVASHWFLARNHKSSSNRAMSTKSLEGTKIAGRRRYCMLCRAKDSS